MDKKLEDKKWKEFFLDNFGTIKSGKDIVQKDMVKGNTPYIAATSTSNGIKNFISNTNNSLESNCISINRTGSVGCAFYHNYEALFSNNCRKFILNEHKNKYVSLFIVNQIKQQKEKYSYGYILGTGRIKRQKIMLPIDDTGNPDFEFMEEYIKTKYRNYIQTLVTDIEDRLTKLNFIEINELDDKEWDNFYIHDIFEDVQRGKRLTEANFIEGEMPYISSKGVNNGINEYVGNTDKVRIFENCLTLANSGSVGSTFYHPYSFVASDHVTHLKNESFDKYIYLFIGSMIKRLGEKYNFNREISDTRLKREFIILPINECGEPDYEYMRQYMINQEIKLLKKYLKYVQHEIFDEYISEKESLMR